MKTPATDLLAFNFRLPPSPLFPYLWNVLHDSSATIQDDHRGIFEKQAGQKHLRDAGGFVFGYVSVLEFRPFPTNLYLYHDATPI